MQIGIVPISSMNYFRFQSLLLAYCFLAASCEQKKNQEKVPAKDTVSLQAPDTSSPAATAPQGLNAEEVQKKLLRLLKQKYITGDMTMAGSAKEAIKMKSGDYTGDGLTDYFITATLINEGADWNSPLNFFYRSEDESISELRFKENGFGDLYLEADTVKTGDIKGKTYLLVGSSPPELSAGESVDVGFQLKGNTIIFHPPSLKKMNLVRNKLQKQVRKNEDAFFNRGEHEEGSGEEGEEQEESGPGN